MNNLQELEKKYEELGKKIERLKQAKSSKRRKPEWKKSYYYIDSATNIGESVWSNTVPDNFRYSQNNCFKTEQEAQEHLENLKTKGELRLLAEELNEDEVIDWNDDDQDKYFIQYDFHLKMLMREYNCDVQNQGTIYCLNETFLDKAINHIGEERLIKMIKSGV